MKRFSTLADCMALDFVNTRPLGVDGPVERLTDFAALLRWCVQMGLVTPAAAKRMLRDDRGALAEAIALREALRTALERDIRPAWAAAVKRINASRRPVAEAVVMGSDGGFVFQRNEVASPVGVVDALAAEMARFVCSGDLEQARKCHAGDCVLWFVDRTRNHSRAWCSMKGCGARAKARAYYARKCAAA